LLLATTALLFAASPGCGGDGSGGEEVIEGSPSPAAPGGQGTPTAQPAARTQTATPAATETGDAVVRAVRGLTFDASLAKGRVLGKPDAPVRLEVFEDFQCPFCLQFTATMEPFLIREYVNTGKVRIEFRHFPILGRESVAAAMGAQCAAEQGRFWPFHKALFLTQAEAGQHTTERLNVGRFSNESLARLAGDVGLDAAAWKLCYEAGAPQATLEADLRAARDAGLRGTPSFIVNGTALPGVPSSEANWRQILDQAAR
jgi:protein-disulfide isomerase